MGVKPENIQEFFEMVNNTLGNERFAIRIEDGRWFNYRKANNKLKKQLVNRACTQIYNRFKSKWNPPSLLDQQITGPVVDSASTSAPVVNPTQLGPKLDLVPSSIPSWLESDDSDCDEDVEELSQPSVATKTDKLVAKELAKEAKRASAAVFCNISHRGRNYRVKVQNGRVYYKTQSWSLENSSVRSIVINHIA